MFERSMDANTMEIIKDYGVAMDALIHYLVQSWRVRLAGGAVVLVRRDQRCPSRWLVAAPRMVPAGELAEAVRFLGPPCSGVELSVVAKVGSAWSHVCYALP
jgi:hypothetical protein